MLVGSMAAIGAMGMIGPAKADVSSVSGGAFGAQVRGLLLNVGPVPTVTLPAAGGGPFVNTLASINLPGTLQTGILTARTAGATGANGFSESSASVANVRVGAAVVTADAITSQCRSDSTGTSGSTTVVNLAVGGIVVNGTVAPNTTINLSPVAVVVLNEQIVSGSTITVNAVRVTLLPGSVLAQTVIIAQSRCGARIVPATTTTTHAPTTSSTVAPTTTTTHSPQFPNG